LKVEAGELMKSHAIFNAVVAVFAGSLLSACASVEEFMPLTMSHANVLAVLNTVDELEVDAGELGKNKAASPSVRSFASRLAQEHTSSIQDRKRLAEKMDVEPKEPQLASALELRRGESKSLLEEKSGRDFDEAYIKDQIVLHEHMIKLLQDTEDSMDEPDLRQHLRYSQPDLLSHLSAARAAERQLLAQHPAE
jgi:putative membrane protein